MVAMAAREHPSIHATEKPLKDVFSDAYLFEVPFYQRPYAWEKEHVEVLLDDLLAALGRDEDAPYFLGSVVLVKGENTPRSQIVDGQQRLTTLTMLLCVLRDLASTKDARADLARDLAGFVVQEGSAFRGTDSTYRITLRAYDNEFFKENLQVEGRIDHFLKEDSSRWIDSRKHMQENTRVLYDHLSKCDEEARKKLASFICRNCYLVLVSTPDADSAFRIFSVMNDRGLDLSPTDITKAEVIGKIDEPLREGYARKWEEEEDRLGRDSFRDLFSHIRMIYRKEKLRGTMQVEFQDHVVSTVPPIRFIDDILIPYSEAYEATSKASYEGAGSDNVNEFLKHLKLLDNFDWIPPVMEYIKRRPDQGSLISFLQKIERLAYGLFIMREDVNERIRRYAGVLRAIQSDELTVNHASLALNDEEKARIMKQINGDVYRQTRVCRPLLLRLDSMLADAGARYDHPITSIEHVLPQTPANDSQWLEWFPDAEERANWTHALANLVLLSRRKNSQASNYEFGRKKSEYFQRGTTPFALTTQVISESEWTPAVLEKRQEELLAVIKRNWDLG